MINIHTQFQLRPTRFIVMYKFVHDLLLSLLFTFPQCGIYTPETYNSNALGIGACRGRNRLWTRTVERYTRTGLHECVVSTMSGSPSETTQDRAQTMDTHLVPE